MEDYVIDITDDAENMNDANTNSSKRLSAPSIEDVQQKIEDKIWSLKKCRVPGFKTLIIDGINSEFRTCMHCFKTYSRFSANSIKKHAATHPSENSVIEEGSRALRKSMTDFVVSNSQSFRVVENPRLHNVLKITFELG